MERQYTKGDEPIPGFRLVQMLGHGGAIQHAEHDFFALRTGERRRAQVDAPGENRLERELAVLRNAANISSLIDCREL